MDKKKWMRTVYLAALVLALSLVFVLLLCLGTTERNDIKNTREDERLVTINDYVCRELADEDAPIGVYKEYTFRLPGDIDANTNSCLGFYTVHQYVKVYIDEECVYSICPSDKNRMTKTVGSNWTMIPLTSEDIKKSVRVELIPVYESFRNREVVFEVGTGLDIYRNRLRKDLPQILFGGIAILIGVLFICIAGYDVIKKHRGSDIVALGEFSALLGVWRLTDTRFTPFMFPDNTLLVYYISMTALMLAIVPVMKWMKNYCPDRFKSWIDIYMVIALLNCIVQLMLQIMGLVDVRQSLIVTQALIVGGFLLDTGIFLYEKKTCGDKYRMPLGNKLLFLCEVGVIADILQYYVRGNSSGLLFSLCAIVIYILIMGVASLYRYGEQEITLAKQERLLIEKERKIVIQERKLTESRIKAMMSQIRSHFIFNVLANISTYCKIDPAKADQALIRFARYLRKNISFIEKDTVVPFDEELEQVEDYVALEQLRFPDRIAFVKEIATSSFSIPPLTIQPLVENAIKHGLVEHGRSGTIIVNTQRTGNEIRIRVMDDGVGFDANEEEREESVGIRNVRYRIENMVHGSLTIESTKGNGTTVTITIPVEETGA